MESRELEDFLRDHANKHRKHRIGGEHYLVLAILAALLVLAVATYWRPA